MNKYNKIREQMDKLEFNMENMSNSFNPESGKQVEFDKIIGKMFDEHNSLTCELMLEMNIDDIEFSEIDPLNLGVEHTLKEFKDKCSEGDYKDGRGYAFYINTNNQESTNCYLSPSWMLKNKYRRDFDRIMWYEIDEMDIDNQSTNTQSFEDIEEEF